MSRSMMRFLRRWWPHGILLISIVGLTLVGVLVVQERIRERRIPIDRRVEIPGPIRTITLSPSPIGLVIGLTQAFRNAVGAKDY
jgi:hypothetical protein